MLSLRVEMDFDTFYKTNGPTLFVDRMAAFLGIPNHKLRIVSIVKGSVKIKFEVIMDEETKKSDKIVALTNTTAANGTSSAANTTKDTCGGGGIS